MLTVEVPPLRARREDISALLDYFLHEAARSVSEIEQRTVVFHLEPDARELLKAYDYPGNIRALRNLVYELTSYVNGDEPITYTLAAHTLARQKTWASAAQETPPPFTPPPSHESNPPWGEWPALPVVGAHTTSLVVRCIGLLSAIVYSSRHDEGV